MNIDAATAMAALLKCKYSRLFNLKTIPTTSLLCIHFSMFVVPQIQLERPTCLICLFVFP